LFTKPCVHLSPYIFINETESSTSSFVLSKLSVNVSKTDIMFGVERYSYLAVRLARVLRYLRELHVEVRYIFLAVGAVRCQQTSAAVAPGLAFYVRLERRCYMLLKLRLLYPVFADELYIQLAYFEFEGSPGSVGLGFRSSNTQQTLDSSLDALSVKIEHLHGEFRDLLQRRSSPIDDAEHGWSDRFQTFGNRTFVIKVQILELHVFG